MSRDKDKDLESLDFLDDDLLGTEEIFDPEDRFTTQDLSEIDHILNDESLLNDYILEVESAKKEEKRKAVSPSKGKENDISSKAKEVETTPIIETEPKDTETVSEETAPVEEKTEPVLVTESLENSKPINDSNSVKEEKKEEATKEAAPVNEKTESAKAEENSSSEIPFNQKTIGKKNSNVRRTKGLPRRKKPNTWKRTIAIFLGVLLILGTISVSGVYLLYTANFTDISATKYTPKEKTEIYTADDVLIAQLFSENRSYVSIEEVPDDLINALIATEDSRFYSHGGVDYIGVARALVSNIIGGNSTGQGASTITQQLARLLYLPDISTESTFMDSLNRKFKEISISYQLEDKYTKDQILEIYLNEYYLGSGAYGVEAAAETYFGKSVSQLNLAESAMIAGLPQAPSTYAPNVNFELAKERQKQVLERMVAVGYITQEQADEAYNTPIEIVPWSESSLNSQIEPGYQNFIGRVIDEYASAMSPNLMKERGLTEEEAQQYARTTIASGGFKIYTTIYSDYQDIAIDTMENMLADYGYSQSRGYTGALVTVDRSGAIRAYYGGNEEYSQIDMASTPRQPGSNIKPIYYALAIENGTYKPTSVLRDGPINIGGYSPRNSDGSYMGNITFTQSLVNSRNTTSVQIFNALGVNNAIEWIKQFGFDSVTDDDYNLSVALGGFTYGIKPYQMAAAFNTFNDNGVYNQAYFIEKVTTTSGDSVLEKSQLNLVSAQIMSASTASTMWNIMNQVVTRGTGTNAQCGIATAGKTGTTDNKENLWFTGMTSDVTTSVWLGNLDYKVIGGSSAIPAAIYGSYLRTLIRAGYVE